MIKWKCHLLRANRRCWNFLPDEVVIILLVLALSYLSPGTELWQQARSTFWMSTCHALTSPLSITCHRCPSLLGPWTLHGNTEKWHNWFYQQSRTGTGKGSPCDHCPGGQNRKTALTLSCRWALNVKSFFFRPLSKLNAVKVRPCFSVWPVYFQHEILRK